MSPISIIIVEKSGILKLNNVTSYKEEELFKKCGFKKIDGFKKQTEWTVKHENTKYIVMVYGKTDGRATSENKYDFPPPIDQKLFFGNCAIVLKTKEDNNYASLTIPMWDKIYEKLFGGFEDLSASALEDEEEEDELENIPNNKKTKHGYLKDGFVIDSDGEIEDGSDESSNEEEEEEDITEEEEENEGTINLDDIRSELSEEEYEYSEDEVEN